MINLNQEYTYYKEKSFINYCLGVFKFNNTHHDYNELDAYYSDNWGMKHFTIDYTSEEDRKMLSKLIFRKIKNDERAYLMFRLDFDWRKFEVEDESFKRDWDEVRTYFDAYCREHNVCGYLFTHFAQNDEEHLDALLPRHIHIVYEEPFSGETFSEFLHRNLE